MQSFEISVSKTFLGLDKNNSHTFKIMDDLTSDYIDYFELSPTKLQEDVLFLIDGKLYPARVRWSRGNRSKPHFLEKEALPARDVLFFHWAGKDYEKTQLVFRHLFFEDIKLSKINGAAPQSRVRFNHLELNIFLVRKSN